MTERKRTWGGEALFWNIQSLTWDDLLQRPRHRERLEAVLRTMSAEGKPGDQVLDVGCGTGTYSVGLARRGFRVVGLDLSPAMLRRAASKAGPLLGDRLELRRADFNRPLPFADGSFDHAVCVCSLHCVRDAVRFFAEIARVVQPGGRLVLVTLSGQEGGVDRPRHDGRERGYRTSLPRRVFWRAKRRMARGRRWRRYPREELIRLVGESGFELLARAGLAPALLFARRPATSPR